MASSSVLDAVEKDDEEDLQTVEKPLNERQKLANEVKKAIEKSGKKLKTLAEHKADVQKKKDDARDAAMSRRDAEERSKRAEAERMVRKWDMNYTSEDTDLKDDGLKVCYCRYCGQYSMILDVSVSTLPTRKSDGAHVVNEKRRVCRRNMVEGQAKLIKRKGGLEKQYRWFCKQCGLFLCYRSVPADARGKYTFIVKDALTDNLGELKEAGVIIKGRPQ
mmetsp:Transcript_30013/g.52690  ORF Transcript_30013/g.52690 Transcript_30013/m.52690 type:complete len:219 (+) Transcript_30013:8-664(+)|eukprot:CAMPEP_0197527224 /NCGR_PEP_ID=MMETSP1318-20131121/20752_1 /TAXON_ID=552666 /ORGANISM="Partenskyella glossopodia, Strain RCC365" /LENGTH=218 /DNA_ID=CAMNT_0043081753 /DNA_START=5 /DNA_END=658 /DNA_ORIENTATION=+